MAVHVPLVFHYPEWCLFWSIFLLVMLPEMLLIRRSKKTAPGPQDAGTMRVIVVGNQLAMLGGLAASFLPWALLPGPRTALFVGTAMLFAGGVLRRICFRTLGKHFTGAVTVLPDQPVIDRGPYRWIRHPSYTAGFLVFVGMGIALGSWPAIVISFLGPCYTYARRVSAEEKALVETIGEPYRAYMARTKRFIPFVL